MTHHKENNLSIICFWYKDIIYEFKAVVKGDRKFLYSIIIATIPASLVGLFLNDLIKNTFFNIESMNYLSINYLLLAIIIFGE